MHKMPTMDEQIKKSFSRLQSATGLSQAEITERMGETEQVITNWKSRGISLAGLLKAQAVFGINANWLQEGVGPVTLHAAAVAMDDPLAVMAAGYGVLLKQIPERLRKDWHDRITQDTLRYLVSIARPAAHGTSPEDK